MSRESDVEAGGEDQPKPAAGPLPGHERQVSGASVVSSIVDRWQREDLLKKATSLLRVAALVFSLIASVVLGSNKHGDWKDFEKYEEYRYLLVISILAFVYAGAQVFREVHLLWKGQDWISPARSLFLDFFGDQIMAYLLISALSAAASLTNRMREGTDNLFTDASAASVSMAFFAFLALALSAMVSGFKLSNQTYI